jgi:hypothetical protein
VTTRPNNSVLLSSRAGHEATGSLSRSLSLSEGAATWPKGTNSLYRLSFYAWRPCCALRGVGTRKRGGAVVAAAAQCETSVRYGPTGVYNEPL